jgi:hypothetical protein
VGRRGDFAYGDARLARAGRAYARWFVSPEPREPKDEAEFCAIYGIEIKDLARFESGPYFTTDLQRAVAQKWASEIPELIKETKRMVYTTRGVEKALWMETLTRLIAPKLAEVDPFRGWHGAKLDSAPARTRTRKKA